MHRKHFQARHPSSPSAILIFAAWTRAPSSSTPPTPPSSPNATSKPAALPPGISPSLSLPASACSTPLDGPPTDPDTHRDPDGRLFNGVTPENFHFLLEKVGFHRINRWDGADTLGRKDRRWATQLFVLEGAGSRSLDQIEAILNSDKKDATYKPARLRALAELE
jgi:hypothetical protein